MLHAVALCALCMVYLGKERFPIKITLRDGKTVDGKAWDTTPYQVAEQIR